MKRRTSALLGLLLLLAGCAPGVHRQSVEPPCVFTPQGTVVWAEEYEFVSLGEEWQLMRLAEDDYAFAWIRAEKGPFPSQSTIAYAEEPFGFSRDLRERSREFLKRFLWASRVDFGEPAYRSMALPGGGKSLEMTVEGKEPVQEQKVWSKVLFTHRGERVVAFYLTQWRPEGEPYDYSVEKDFQRFTESFRYLKPSFYQRLSKE